VTWLAVVAGLVVLAAARRMLTAVTVRGTSMAPTLADGQRVLALRRGRYVRGDVVVFGVAGPPVVAGDPVWRVKRVAAVGLDSVPAWMGQGRAGTVPAGTVVVSGDNARSQDSRQLGFVPVAAIAGRVLRASAAPRAADPPAGGSGA
jgi:signal peptidase I